MKQGWAVDGTYRGSLEAASSRLCQGDRLALVAEELEQAAKSHL